MSRTEVARIVREGIASIVPAAVEARIPGDRHLRDLGADSVDRIEIVLLLMRRLGIREPMASFNALPNVDALIDFLWSRATPSAGGFDASRD